MKKIIEQIENWPLIKQLPPGPAGFDLSVDLAENGGQYSIFSYCNAEECKSLSVLYDSATKDFLTKIKVGLNEFYDISFICTDLVSLENILGTKLEPALFGLADGPEFESIFRAKHIIEWPYGANLPGEIAGFRLFVAPGRPLKTVNGSYVIIDYSDFAAASNLSISYNVYRDEFFGQLCRRHTPQMIGTFDARELGELAEKLDRALRPVLEELRGCVDRREGEESL